MKRCLPVGLVIAAISAPAFAGPKVKVDTAEFDVGVKIEGAQDKVRHQFILTNTGDDVLRVKDVRAG